MKSYIWKNRMRFTG